MLEISFLELEETKRMVITTDVVSPSIKIGDTTYKLEWHPGMPEGYMVVEREIFDTEIEDWKVETKHGKVVEFDGYTFLCSGETIYDDETDSHFWEYTFYVDKI